MMNTQNKKTPEPVMVTDSTAAELSESGHWGETQVIEVLKDAASRRKDPRRVLRGVATQPIGGIFHPVASREGVLHFSKPTLRARMKRLFGYLKG